jgi:ankyrin repeat protein
MDTAIANNDIYSIKLLLKNNVDIHADNDFALRWASQCGHLELIKLLLENNADIHASNDYALHIAYMNDHLETVKLLENNAHIDRTLRYASERGYPEIVNYY